MKIGIFDSGIGGLSVLYEAMQLLPHEQFIYYADEKHVPYGEKTREEIIGYVDEIIQFMIDHDCKAIVIACNTATSAAVALMRKKYDIPLEKKVFVYGGNLGKPQGIDFLIECLHSQENSKDNYFLIVGDGTEYGKIEKFVKSSNQNNIRLMKRLPQEDYDTMVGACDVGMIFLDHRFTIPNFPSRLLSYMQAKIPVLACTDSNTDIGRIVENAGFGNCCESNNVEAFGKCTEKIMQIGNVADVEWNYLNEYYSTKTGYNIIMKHFKK